LAEKANQKIHVGRPERLHDRRIVNITFGCLGRRAISASLLRSRSSLPFLSILRSHLNKLSKLAAQMMSNVGDELAA
jgi:hypothetical protein